MNDPTPNAYAPPGSAYRQPSPTPGMPAAVLGESPNFSLRIRRSLRMHGRLAWMVGIGVALLAVAAGAFYPKVYSARSIVYVDPNVAKTLNDAQTMAFDQFRYAAYLDQQMQTVVRPDIMAGALKTLPPEIWHLPGENDQTAIDRLAKKLVVERQLTSYQFSIKLSGANPDDIAAIVNAITDAYLKGGRKDELAHSDGRLQLLDEERQRVREELEADRREQASLAASMGVTDPVENRGNPFDTSTANIRMQLQTARQQRDLAQAELASVGGQSDRHRSGLAAQADEAIATDAGLSALKTSVNARRVVLQGQMAGLTPGNPQYKQDREELDDLDRSLEAKTGEVRARLERRIEDKLRTDLRRTAQVEATLNGQLAAETSKATGASPKLQRAQELAADIGRLTARYSLLDEAYTALAIETGGPSLSHRVVAAQVPASPDPNKGSLLFLAALPLGLLCGVASAVVARLRDGRIYLGSDLEQAAGFAPIAVLPARAGVSAGAMEEYVLRLAAGIESAYRMAGARSFIVTAVSSETPTGSLVRDLARRLEDLRLRVRVLPADELLVTSPESNERRMATAVTPTPVRSGEGIASSKLERMKGQNDIVLVEAAPLLHSAATEYAARCADASILVVESGTTTRAELSCALTLLSRLHINGIALVLDELKLENADEAFRQSVHLLERRPERRPVEAGAGLPPDSVQAATEFDASGVPPVHTRKPSVRLAEQPKRVTVRHDLEFRVPAGADATDGDPRPVGQLMNEKDTILPVPSYTRVRIRQAFKEQEVNSKTTWFSKLFRGDSPATFRIVPEDGDEDSDFGPERDPVAHPASAKTLNDPDVKNLIDRIKPRQDVKPPVRPPRPVQPIPEPPAASPVPSLPFVERRREPRPVEGESLAARPPRPLSFTELVASLPPPSVSPQPAAPPSLDPEAFASPATSEAAEEFSTWPFSDRQPIFRKRQPEAAAEPAIEWEPEWKPEPEPISWNTHAWPVPKPAPIAAVPAPEIAFVPELEIEPEPQPSAFASPDTLYARTSEPPALFPEEKPTPEPETVRSSLGKLVPVFTPRPSPSQRFAALERSQAIPDPFSDPEPSPRAYRLEPPPQPKLPVPNAPILSGVEAAESSPEACAASEPPAPAPEAPKLVPAGTAFPPDREAQSRFLNLGRRSTDKLGPDGQPVVPPFTRRWALLSQFEPDLSDPQPAPRRRSTDIKPRPSDPIPSEQS